MGRSGLRALGGEVTERREYLVTYRQRLTARELAYVRTMAPTRIIEVTPDGWTRMQGEPVQSASAKARAFRNLWQEVTP